jgi:predicted nucleic acid-binding Zn ribbon protein
MDDIRELCSVVERRKKRLPAEPSRLGELAGEIIEKRVLPQYSRFGTVIELWGQMLPQELVEHCRLEDINGGCLKVRVDSPSYLYELRMCGEQLVEQLQKHCPRARIKEIKFRVG